MSGDFPLGPVSKTPCFQGRGGQGSLSDQGTGSQMPESMSLHATTKIL